MLSFFMIADPGDDDGGKDGCHQHGYNNGCGSHGTPPFLCILDFSLSRFAVFVFAQQQVQKQGEHKECEDRPHCEHAGAEHTDLVHDQ